MEQRDKSLPIYSVLASLLEKLKNSNNVVLQADPGAGKSTVIPLELLEANVLKGQKIVMLEPRRMAAKSIARFLSKQLSETVGQTVGYQIKNDTKLSNSTKIEIVTEGVLLRRLQTDPELTDVGILIFDEFHERSINADLSLMLSLESQQVLREDLKILVMSATFDTSFISSYLHGAPVIKCSGRSFPVTETYMKPVNSRIEINVLKAIQNVIDDEGDILVFLSGIGDIKRCINKAEEFFGSREDIDLLPLHGSLPTEQQDKAITKTFKKKIIFSTNIAETSLTIEGVTCVIDSGLEKVLAYDPSSGMSKLMLSKISKASAEQRKGRAGRLKEGKCIRLWTETEHASLIDYQREEILVSDLSGVVLELANAGFHKYSSINWLTPPPASHFDSSQSLLIKLDLLDDEGRVTSLGKVASSLPVHPRLAKILLSARNSFESQISCYLAAMLPERDLIKDSHSVDILLRLEALIEAIQGNGVQSGLNQQALKVVGQDFKVLRNNTPKVDEQFKAEGIQDSVGYLLLSAFPDRLAKRRGLNSCRYKLANGKGVTLQESDPLTSFEYLVVIDSDAQNKEGRVYSAAPFDINILSKHFSEQIVTDTDYEISSSNKIYAHQRKKYGQLIIEEDKSKNVPQEFIRDSLVKLIPKDYKRILNWTPECEDWLNRVTWLGEKLDGFPNLNIDFIMEDVAHWLLPYLPNIRSFSELKNINLFPLLSSILTYSESKLLDSEAPEFYLTPSNKNVRIIYSAAQEPTVSVILQELFGEVRSPMLAGRTIPLRFELLSPAKRPIQITTDLEKFWSGSYVEVAKDMRAKYPKHRWPEKPLEEKPGRSIKPK
ncbi:MULTISPECIES: ATP-dependent helicase HrpB [unclassified Pseudoalteromonas]|uniref:ATP-dependent helicase HrpB n=1 Tax=unclassified Pseudoalteromonas TaxID=194690 RepID=UPI0004B1ACE1|nr:MULTISPECIES: ATP-dependent helicase HrpB [unclassified Pseudoalteromonas]